MWGYHGDGLILTFTVSFLTFCFIFFFNNKSLFYTLYGISSTIPKVYVILFLVYPRKCFVTFFFLSFSLALSLKRANLQKVSLHARKRPHNTLRSRQAVYYYSYSFLSFIFLLLLFLLSTIQMTLGNMIMTRGKDAATLAKKVRKQIRLYMYGSNYVKHPNSRSKKLKKW